MSIREHKKDCIGRVLVSFLLLALPPLLVGGAVAGERIIAIADIHGNFEAFTGLLRQSGLVDPNLQWIGEGDTLIQTGDFTDRGPEVRRVMDFLMSLEESAPKNGGKAIILLGNHEMMNMIGQLADVTEADYASFTDSRSERRRRSAYRSFTDFRKRRAKRLNLPEPSPTPEMEAEWMEAHPPGFVAQREAFSPKGTYGKWLRKRRVVVKQGDTLFLHAGINPLIAQLSIESINERVWQEIAAFDRYKRYMLDQKLALDFFTFGELVASVQEELEARRMEISEKTAAAAEKGNTYSPSEREQNHIDALEGFMGLGQWLTINPGGILWFRGYARWTDEEGQPQVESLLEQYDARHFFVGHNPQLEGHVRSRFDGRIFLADTGMLSSFYPGGRASAVEIWDGVFRAIYLDGDPVQLYPLPASAPEANGRPVHWLTNGNSVAKTGVGSMTRWLTATEGQR